MGDPYERTETWSPAFILARTALGSVCVDPSWNYLVELGLALQELAGFDGMERLRGKLPRSPGTQHHVCMAAELYRRGLLEGLEPAAGAGAASNDLLVGTGADAFQVEVKEFSSSTPSRTLAKELTTKQAQLPAQPLIPTVFHAVLSETQALEKEREQEFCDRVRELVIPTKISAIVIGRRFIDGAGGRVKRDVVAVLLNPNAVQPIAAPLLEYVFQKNYDALVYPVHALGSTMVIGPGASNELKLKEPEGDD
jgi:hypothetical protein